MQQLYKISPEKRDVLSAITHVYGTGMIQTVTEVYNHLFYRLIKRFGEKTGVPVLLNASFNENEPIVNRPEEASDSFLRTKMDLLVIGSFYLERIN